MITDDHQTRISDSGLEDYSDTRILLLSPQALGLGQVQISWNPETDDAIVHRVVIRRAGTETDVLAQRNFTVLQREDGLEQSRLTGVLTGALQIPGLQVGDEIEFSMTVRQRSSVLGSVRMGERVLPFSDRAGTYRSRVTWPAGRSVNWRTTPDIAGKARTLDGAESGVEVLLTDPDAIVPIQGSPPRFNRFRTIEFSEFADWSAVSRQFFALFDSAAAIAPGSALDSEVARIAALSDDPKIRTEAALALVQDQVRYVFVGLDGGNYRPITAEQTWQERFGDCKAKTALLWAILRKLGVAAEPVLVNSSGGDGIDQRLPSPTPFDHVLLRATLGSQNYLLDGTRAGERDLAYLDPLPYRWLLPLRADGTKLEQGRMPLPPRPQLIKIFDLDASAGANRSATAEIRHLFLGGPAFQMATELSAATAEEANAIVRDYWRSSAPRDLRAESSNWTFDASRQALTFSVHGTVDDLWAGSSSAGYLLDLPGLQEFAPTEPERPVGQDPSVPFQLNFPSSDCVYVTVRLPAQRPRFHWDFVAPNIDRTVAGMRMFRQSDMREAVMRIVMARQTLQPEMNAAETAVLKAALPSFKAHDAYLVETLGASVRRGTAGSTALPLASAVDWPGFQTPCTLNAAP